MRWPFASRSEPSSDVPEKSESPGRRFAFRLFRQLAGEPNARNIFFSPASVMLCLWPLHDGAAGETREAMARVLEVAGLAPKELQSAVATLRSALQIESPGLKLEAANSLWCNQGFRARSEYIAGVRRDYGAEVFALDFAGDQAVATINAWVAQKTQGKIGNILSSLDPLTFLVAINAVYFKDSWSQLFMPKVTREEWFHTSEGQKLKVPLMNQYGSYSYYENSGFQAVCLPYKTSRLAMYVFLPARKSSLREFQQDLNSGAWDKWMRRFETMEGHLRLPRFKLTYQAMLNRHLSQLGMGPAFDRQRARFDAISPPPPAIWIETVLHRAFLEVNEEGTEAAATTFAMMPLSSEYGRPRIRTFEMIVDRPFFFAICDTLTNTILFMGSVEEPGS
ncbi:MAG TPA: serpin family protein [Terriglobales bacterium]|nr:serpin family protein [Terriglobales bacterium]